MVSVWLDDRLWTAHVWARVAQGRGCLGRTGRSPFVEVWGSLFLGIIDA